MKTAPDPRLDLCPLCQQQNGCGVVAGSPSCWCMSVVISPDALARVPREAKGLACVCQGCGVTAAPTAHAEPDPTPHDAVTPALVRSPKGKD